MTDHCKKCGDIIEYKVLNRRTYPYDPVKHGEHICLDELVKFRRECRAQSEWEWAMYGEIRKWVDEYFKRREEEVRQREQEQRDGTH
jgi:hypothetical protein